MLPLSPPTPRSTPRRRPLAALALALLLACLGGAAAQCVIPPEGLSFEIAGVGTAYFGDLRTERERDRAVFSRGVCIAGQDAAWTILADTVTVEGLTGTLELVVEAPSVLLPDWVIRAARLSSRGEELELEGATFTGAELTGFADRLVIDPATGASRLEGMFVSGGDYLIRGASATLAGTTVAIDDAVATTCLCDDPFYEVHSARAELDLTEGRIVLRGGRLRTGALEVPLAEEVVLSPEGIADLTSPLRVEYTVDDPDGDRKGTGLGVVLPTLRDARGLDLETGLTGLDRDYPFRGFALAHYEGVAPGRRGAEVEFTIGRGRTGPHFGVTVERNVLPWLSFGFAVENLQEEGEGYVHQGVLRLRAASPRLRSGGASLAASATAFAAASAQAAPGPEVAGARLGAAATLDARIEGGPLGRGRLLVDLSATGYPDLDASQVGARLRPSFVLDRDGVLLRLGGDVQGVLGGSPFGTDVDRLVPHARLSGSLALSGTLAPGLEGHAAVRAAYGLIDEDDEPAGLRTLTLTGGLDLEGPVALHTGLDVELAGLFEGRGGENHAVLEAEADLITPPGTFGVRLRYDLLPGGAGLERLEARVEVPIGVGDVTLEPFLAFDFAPTVASGAAPIVSGHGLELTWRSCCGTVVVGYRQLDNAFSTTLALRFEE